MNIKTNIGQKGKVNYKRRKEKKNRKKVIHGKGKGCV